MTEERHTAVLAWRKATLWVLIVLCVLEILQKDSVANALWLFCTAGVVPGRKQPLAPDTVLWILCGVVAAVLLAITIRMIIKLFARHRCKLQQDEIESLPDTGVAPTLDAPVALQVSAHASEQSAQPKPMQTHKIQTPHLPAPPIIISIARENKTHSVVPLLRIGMGFILYLGWMGRVLESLVRLLARHSAMLGVKITARIKEAVMVAARWSRKTAAAFTRWLMPRLREFDAWLEVQTRNFIAKTQKKATKHEKLQNVAFLARESRRAMNARLPLAGGVKREQGQPLGD